MRLLQTLLLFSTMKKFLVPSTSNTPAAQVVRQIAGSITTPGSATAPLSALGSASSGPFAASAPDMAKRKSPKPAVLTNTVVEAPLATSPPLAATAETAVVEGSSNKFQRSLLSSRQRDALLDYISWNDGDSVPYAKVVEVFEEIAAVSGRLDKENIMSKLFTAVLTTTPADLDSVVYLASNTIYPAYDGLELGIGDSLLVKAICEATGRKKDAVEEAYEKEGDLGEVAVQSRANQKMLTFAAKPKPLHAAYVLEQFRVISQIKGDKSQARKVDVIKGLMVRCQGQEAKYLVRALQGKLRIGTAFQTVLVALSHTLADVQRAFVNDFPPESFADKQDEPTKSSKVGGMQVDDGEISHITNLSVEDAIALSATEKETKLFQLLSHVHDLETPEARKLRQHYAQSTNRSSSNAADVYDFADVAIKRAFSECPNLSLLLQASLNYPLHLLYQRCRLLIGVPVAPMLAKPTKEIGEVLRRLENQAFTMEYKYDGERAQVHFWVQNEGSDPANNKYNVKIFSRNSEDNSKKYPDLKDVVVQSRLPFLQSCIVDAEVVAYDREKQTLLPFQILSTRKRKLDTSTAEETGELNFTAGGGGTATAAAFEEPKVKVILEVFDLLYLNGQSLLRESLRTRRALLRLAFQPSTTNYFRFADGADHFENGDTAPIETILTESCTNMCEGLMVKTLDEHASYEPSKRSLNWLKVKKDYIAGMGVCDSVDLVPIGAYYGRGKRSGVYGAYLVACYEPERDVFQSVCKVGTGFTDEMLQSLFQKMSKKVLQSSKKPANYEVGDMLAADVWFTAASNTNEDDTEGHSGGCVWEIQAADLSRSSVHRGGVGRVGKEEGDAGNTDDIRGIGLRFPRFLRERDDKRPDQATTSEQIVDMFYSQSGMEKGGADDDEGDEWI